MEEKKVLNEEELENISGGMSMHSKYCCRIYCMTCDTCLEDDVLWDMAEQTKQHYERSHSCPNGGQPRIYIQTYTRSE